MPKLPKGGIGRQVLDAAMDPGSNDAKASTIREYLKALLKRLWEEEEGFSGKRPLGNSGWQHEVACALVKAKLLNGRLDSEGAAYGWEQPVLDHMMFQAIKAL